MWTRNPPNVAPLQIPTSMFCGFPVTDSTEPTFAPIARPIRYGRGRTRNGPSAASSTGRDDQANRVVHEECGQETAAHHDAEQQAVGRARPLQHPLRRPFEE